MSLVDYAIAVRRRPEWRRVRLQPGLWLAWAYRTRALDVSIPMAADRTATTEEIMTLDAMSETSSPFLLTISMTARSESTWGNRSGQAHRSVNTHTTRLAAGIRMDAHSRARIIFVINDFLFFISVRSIFYCSVSAFIFLRMMK